MPHRVCFTALVALFCLAGCSRTPEPVYTPAKQTVGLEKKELQEQIHKFLTEHCGTYAVPKLFDSDVPVERLKRGQQVYMKRCVQCHGVTGGGDGPAAEFLTPKPRDYRLGVFKFASTPYGSRPRRDDILRTVERGLIGTSMPGFKLLSRREIDDVVDYVLSLTHRGELEIYIANEAKSLGEIEDTTYEDAIDTVRSRWRSARQKEILPFTRQPEFTMAMVEQGKQAFLTKGCAKCHGEDGRGASTEVVNMDDWGHPSRAADLTSGMLRGGSRPHDIYRRVAGGINGTRMPGNDTALKDEPETLWNLVAYVLHVSNRRRAGEMPPAEAAALKGPVTSPAIPGTATD